jgi:hypothetical protein
MLKFFMQQYNIPTKKDINSLILRMDKLEKLIKSSAKSSRTRRAPARGKDPAHKSSVTASDVVLSIIRKYKDGAGFAQIKAETDFGEKKLRNIIFRLDQTNKIKRKSRGIYIAA